MKKIKALDCIDIIEKELKALEIIKKKRVNVNDEIFDCLNYEMYVKIFVKNDYLIEYMLTQKEFNLLKEVLCNDK